MAPRRINSPLRADAETSPLSQRCVTLRLSLVTARTDMKSDWRAIFGPTLTTAVALIAFYIDRHFVTVPNPAPLFVCIVALASSLSGLASGLISAVIAVVSSALFFLNHRAVPGYDTSDFARMIFLALTA